jgi:hypothetical protein
MNSKLYYALYNTCSDSWLENVIFKNQIISPNVNRMLLNDAAIQRVSQRAIEAGAFCAATLPGVAPTESLQ